MKITSLHNIREAILTVWRQIGRDIVACSDELDIMTTNASAIAACLDADRLVTYGFTSEQREFKELCRTHGRSIVMRALEAQLVLIKH